MAGKTVRRRKQSSPESTAEAADAPDAAKAGTAPPPPTDAAKAKAPEPAALADPNARRRTFTPATPKPAPAPQDREIPVPAGLSELAALADGDMDMGALLGSGAQGLPEVGAQITGTVLAVGRQGVQLDVGARTEGWIDRDEVPDVSVGDTVEAFVVAADDLSVTLTTQLSGEAAGRHLDEALEQGIPIEGVVRSRNKGGYSVSVGDIHAFCPASQMARLPLADPDSVVGDTLAFLVLEADEKVVLSRRALEERDLEATRAKRWATLEEGDVLDAVVTSVQPWGCFLDAEGVDLRMPAREMAWESVEDTQAVASRGDRVQVRVVQLDRERERVTVSLKDPELDPWRTATSRFPPGRLVEGRVVNHTDFGIFVEVAPGLQGLVHKRHMARFPDVGSTFEVRIGSLDPDRQRLDLVPSDVDPDAQAANTVGVEVNGEVIEVGDRGVVVRLEDGRRAFLPAREVDLDPGTVLAQRFRAGHTIDARVIREDDRGVTLSQKAPEADDWRDALDGGGNTGGMGTFGDLLRKARS